MTAARARRKGPSLESAVVLQVRQTRTSNERSTAPRARLGQHGATVLACAATTALAASLSHYFDSANIVMLFLLTVALIAVRLGREAAVMAAFLSVASFDFFFVPPKYSFTVNDAQYLLTFAVMLVVALIIGQLTAGLRRQALTASLKEERTRAMYDMGRELSGALSLSQAVDIVRRFLSDAIGADVLIFVQNVDGELKTAHESAASQGPAIPPHMLEFARAEGDYVDLDAKPPVAYLPLRTTSRVRGVMAVSLPTADTSSLEEHHDLIEAVGSLIAIVLERLHYVEIANSRQLEIQTERLRSSILSALSHDIRTPLTALTGLADSLSVSRPSLAPRQHDTAIAIRDQALRLSGLIANLLDMAKLNAGDVKLRKEWQPLEEVIGSSIKLIERSLNAHPVRVTSPRDLPLLQFDSVLIERVLCNLLENAAKYAPADSPIDIAARDTGDHVEVSVRDYGAGVPKSQRKSIFEMFVRGTRESNKAGVGMGLAICRAIVESHGGTIDVENATPGARFTFTLPKGDPPPLLAEEAPVGVAT